MSLFVKCSLMLTDIYIVATNFIVEVTFSSWPRDEIVHFSQEDWYMYIVE